jgi:branched-chain amino acid transport system substrate-binding protein
MNDDYGRTYVSAFKTALGEVADRMIVAQATYEVTKPMISSQIVTLRASNADVLMNFSLGKFTAQAIQRARELGWKPLQFVPYAVSSPKVLSQGGSPGELAGLISTGFAKTPSDPAWADDPEYNDYLAWIGKYYTGGDPTDDLNVLAYVSAGLLTHVLSAAGDDLSRENIIRIASNLSDVRVPMLLPGTTANTSPTNYRIFERLQLLQFDGTRWAKLTE